MSTSINLQSYAEACISDATYGMETLDVNALREAVYDQVHSAAENACIYTSHCLEIISRYERDADTHEIEDLTCGREFTAEQWQEAMQSYAYGVAYSVLNQLTCEMLGEIETAAGALADAAECGDTEPRISADCPHGWAPHDREDSAGVHYWEPAELEGCKAVAVHVAGIWLSYTRTPNAAV
jgi:hypothetical protein